MLANLAVSDPRFLVLFPSGTMSEPSLALKYTVFVPELPTYVDPEMNRSPPNTDVPPVDPPLDPAEPPTKKFVSEALNGFAGPA